MTARRGVFTRLMRIIYLAVIVSLAAAAPIARAQSPEAFRRGEVIVEINAGASIEAINARFGTTTIQRIYGTNFYRLATPSGKKENKWRKRLSRDPEVLSASLNAVMSNPINVFGRSIANFPGDRPAIGRAISDYRSQFESLGIRDAQIRSTGRSVVVAVIDTGVDSSHPEIAPRLWSNSREIGGNSADDDGNGLTDDLIGWDFLDGDNDPSEKADNAQLTVSGHGTFIAGLVALLAPEARIMPLRAFDREGFSDAFTVAAAIKYAADQQAGVISLSLGSPEPTGVLRDAVAYARSRGSVLVAAAGNENQDMLLHPQFPAGWKDDAMGVAAVGSDDHKAGFSNFGSDISVSAPGVSLVSAFPGGQYATWSGTSFAAPLVSAEAALILSAQPRHPNVRGLIESSAVNIDNKNPGFEGKLGRGRIDPLEALRWIEPTSNIHAEIALSPTGVEPSARGEAEIEINGTEQEFEIEANGLSSRGTYKILVNGIVIVDAAQVSNFGGVKLEFSTRASGDELPLPAALNPVNGIAQVEIRDVQNRVVLQGSFGQPSGGTTSLEKEAKLLSTGVLSSATGDARAKLEPEREELRIRAEGLVPGASYRIFADGIDIGSGVSQSASGQFGFLEVEFKSDGSGDLPLPAAIRPVTGLRVIELRDQAGNTVLRGEFQVGGDDLGGGHGGGGSGGGGGGNGGAGSDRESSFTATSSDPDAEGRVRARVSESLETIELEARRLNAGAMYSIFIDGQVLGSFSADSDGEFRVTWSSQPQHEELQLPSSVRPVGNIHHVEIRLSSGAVVLFADLT